MLAKHYNTLVLGSGISGLTSAWYLKDKNIDFALLEQNPEVGGVMQSKSEKGFEIDLGPNSLMANEAIFELCKKAGLDDLILRSNPAADKKYILRYGQLHEVSPGPKLLFGSPLLGWKSRINLFKEPFVKKHEGEEESIAQFVRRRLGQEFLDNFINPMVAGIYAGDPEKISLKSAFKKMYDLEYHYGSIIRGALKKRKANKGITPPQRELVSFKGGLGSFTRGLHTQIKEHVHCDTKVLSIKKNGKLFALELLHKGVLHELTCNELISTLPAFALAPVVKSLSSTASQILDQIDYPGIATYQIAYRREAIGQKLDSFGYLVPEKEQQHYLGAIWTSTIFEGKAPEGTEVFNLYIGGSRNPEALEHWEEWSQKARREFEGIMGISESPVFQHHCIWPKAIPQYYIGHEDKMSILAELEAEHKGLHIAGSFRNGVAVGDCVANSKALIEEHF